MLLVGVRLRPAPESRESLTNLALVSLIARPVEARVPQAVGKILRHDEVAGVVVGVPIALAVALAAQQFRGCIA